MEITVREPLYTSVQRVILALLVNETLTWFPYIGGSGAYRGSLFGGGLSMELLGTDFDLDAENNLSGTLTEINIFLEDNTLAATITNIPDSDVTALVDTAAAIPDPDNRPTVDDPFWTAFLTALGGPEGAAYVASKGRDVLDGTGADDTLIGRGGNDNLIASRGDDSLDGGAGRKDFWVGRELTEGITANLRDGFIAKTLDDIDTVNKIENVAGTDFADTITGDDGANELWGFGDRDRIFGLDGDDLIFGGDGIDILRGNSGNDRIKGDAGDDLIRGHTGHDVIYGGDGDDSINAAQGNDQVFGGRGDDDIETFGGDDTILANIGADSIHAGSGNDTLFGGSGRDWLFGGSGDDSIDGGNGNDRINPGAGVNTLTGGGGRDRFIFNDIATPRSDVITDYSGNGDNLRFSGANPVDTFISNDGFHTSIDYSWGSLILLGVVAETPEDLFIIYN